MANVHQSIQSQLGVQDIPKKIIKRSTWGLKDWAKGEVCASMCTPPLADPPKTRNPNEILCIKQWSKCKTLTYNRLNEIWPGGVKNVLKIVDPNCILPDIPTAMAKEVVALSLSLYSIRYLSENVQAACKTLHSDLK